MKNRIPNDPSEVGYGTDVPRDRASDLPPPPPSRPEVSPCDGNVIVAKSPDGSVMYTGFRDSDGLDELFV